MPTLRLLDLLGNDTIINTGVTIPSHFWKVALVLDKSGLSSAGSLNDESGGGIIDLIAIDVPNDLTDPNLKSKDWTRWKKPVDLIESLTGYDFLSNLSDEVETRIEANKDFQSYSPFASLLEETESSFSSSQQPVLFLDFPAGHNSLLNDNTSVSVKHEVKKPGTFQISPTEVGITDLRFKEFSFHQLSTSQINIDEVGFIQVCSHQTSSFENCTSKISFTQISPFQVDASESAASQISTSQISSAQITSTQVTPYQVSINQNNFRNLDRNQFYFPQASPTEISFPSSISLQQFLSSHNYDRQNTTVPILSDLLFGDTSFNLDLAIEDLPTGQLAEAQITGFDSTGRPNSGILTLDLDATGKGWFLDPTPWENSEFGIQNSETAFQAQPGSEASDGRSRCHCPPQQPPEHL